MTTNTKQPRERNLAARPIPIDERIGHKYAELLQYLTCSGLNTNNGDQRKVIKDLSTRILIRRPQAERSSTQHQRDNVRKRCSEKQTLSVEAEKRLSSKVPSSIKECRSYATSKGSINRVSHRHYKSKQDNSLQVSSTVSEKVNTITLSSETSSKVPSNSMVRSYVTGNGETRVRRCIQPEKSEQDRSRLTDNTYPGAVYLRKREPPKLPVFQRPTDGRVINWLQKKAKPIQDKSKQKHDEGKAKREAKLPHECRAQLANEVYDKWLSAKAVSHRKTYYAPGEPSLPKSTSSCTIYEQDSEEKSSLLPLDSLDLSDTASSDSENPNSVPLQLDPPIRRSTVREKPEPLYEVVESFRVPTGFAKMVLVVEDHILQSAFIEPMHFTPVPSRNSSVCKCTASDLTVIKVTPPKWTYKQWLKQKFIQARSAEQARWQTEECVRREEERDPTFVNYWRSVLKKHLHRPELNTSGGTDSGESLDILRELNNFTLTGRSQRRNSDLAETQTRPRRLSLRFPPTLLMPDVCTDEDILEAGDKLSIAHTVIVVGTNPYAETEKVFDDSVIEKSEDWTMLNEDQSH